MKNLDLKIINDFLFPDETINSEIISCLNTKKISDYSNELKNFNEYDLFLLDFYSTNISKYSSNDKKLKSGSFFHVINNYQIF